LLLQLKRGPLPVVEPALEVPDARRLPSPERLADDARTPNGWRPATVAVAAETVSTVSVVVRGSLADVGPATVGVALFARETGAKFTWVPLAGRTPGTDGSLSFDVPTTATGELCVTLATDRNAARHGYLARRIVAVGGNTPPGPVVFDAVASHVEFALPATRRLAAPLRVVRTDDAEWLPLHLGSSGMVLSEPSTSVVFGAGSYELVDPIDPAIRLAFDVPTTEPVAISENLSRPRADRP
jgi:hypothetical protein